MRRIKPVLSNDLFRQFKLIIAAAGAGLIALTALAEPVKRPNVVFITIDDMNSDLGLYGHDIVQSPFMDALSKRSVIFDHAYVQAPQCSPSRSSFLTGLYPEQSGVIANTADFRKFVPDVITLPQHFRRHGYYTARVGKIFHYGVPGGIGTNGDDDPMSWDKVVNPIGIDKDVEDQLISLPPGGAGIGGTLAWLNVESEDHEHTDGKVAREAINLLRQHIKTSPDQPFFLGVGFFRPHTPFIAPQKYFDLYQSEDMPTFADIEADRADIPMAALADRDAQVGFSVAAQKDMIRAYYASISFVDAQVGLVVDELDKLGLADNTIIVLLSDHGYHLGRHGLWQKSDLFEDSVRTPLMINAPNLAQPGAHSKALVELVDLYPTLTELADLPAPEHLSGISLTQILLDDPSLDHRESAFTLAPSQARKFYAPLRYKHIMGYTVRTERYRYTQWGADGAWGEELYDYETDRGELKNLSMSGRFESLRLRLRRLLHQRIETSRKPAPGLAVSDSLEK